MCAEVVVEPVAELVGDEQRHRADQHRRPAGQRRWRKGSETRHQQLQRRLADRVIGQDRPAEQQTRTERIDDEITDVGSRRCAEQQLSRKEAAQQRSQRCRPPAPRSFPNRKQCGDDEGRRQRSQRNVGARRQEQLARPGDHVAEPGDLHGIRPCARWRNVELNPTGAGITTCLRWRGGTAACRRCRSIKCHRKPSPGVHRISLRDCGKRDMRVTAIPERDNDLEHDALGPAQPVSIAGHGADGSELRHQPMMSRAPSPRPPTAIRHHANGAKPWRLTNSSR